MSHFTVLVTNTQDNDIDSQLERFYEQGEEGDYFMEKEVYITAEDMKKKAEEVIKEYEEMHKKSPEGNWGKSLKEARENYEAGEYGEVCTSWHGGMIDEDSSLYFVSNPDAKWDWYSIGGRWTGFFKLKEGATGEFHGQSYYLNDKEREADEKLRAEGRVADVCKVKDIDWDAMDKAEKERRGKFYDEYHSAEKKPFIWSEKEVKEIKELSREEYINLPISHATFAVLHNDVWYERGSMGWWGIVSDEMDTDKWDTEFRKLIESLDPETEVTVVDCHI